MAAAKCPHCNNYITRLNANPVPVYVEGKETYKGATFACGSCGVALSAEIDPIAIKADIVNKVDAALKRRS